MSPNMIQVQNVSRIFKSVKKEEGMSGLFKLLTSPETVEHQALKDVSFEIEAGAFVGLIGANGAGKTTLLKILAGLIPPSSGTATVLGERPFDRSLAFRNQIALVMGQKAQLWWDLPAIDAFELLQAIYEIPQKIYKDRVKMLTEMLDVSKMLNTQIRRLSLGERMKMELIGAILHWPKVIFLDEPTIGLDVFAATKLRQFLKEFNQSEKSTIILTSHNMEDIEKLCSRILLVRTGELIYDGQPGTLIREEKCQLRLRLLENPTPEAFCLKTGIAIAAVASGDALPSTDEETTSADDRSLSVTVPRDEIASVIQKVVTHYSLIDLRVEEQSLETVIEKIYSGKRSV